RWRYHSAVDHEWRGHRASDRSSHRAYGRYRNLFPPPRDRCLGDGVCLCGGVGDLMAVNLNAWLRKTPRPTVVLADEKRLEVPKNTHGWGDLTRTIETLQAFKITRF